MSAETNVTVRIRASRSGKGDLLNLSLPKLLSGALPDGPHNFDAFFTDDGIHLRYVGPAEPNTRNRSPILPTPAWANGAKK